MASVMGPFPFGPATERGGTAVSHFFETKFRPLPACPLDGFPNQPSRQFAFRDTLTRGFTLRGLAR